MPVSAKTSITPTVPPERLSEDEAQLDAAAEAMIAQDPRFQADGQLLVFAGELPPEAEDALDHRRDREERIDKIGSPRIVVPPDPPAVAL